jgi:hypothetical protein
MEMGKMSYSTIMMMPVKRFQNYLKWKSDFEEEKRKIIDEEVKKRK